MQVDLSGNYSYSDIKSVFINDYLHPVFVYPNPVSHNQQITFENINEQVMKIKVFDTKGQLIFQTQIPPLSRIKKVFPSGLFFYEVRLVYAISTGKFVVE